QYSSRHPVSPWSCAFAMAEATAVFTWVRRRRTLGDMGTNPRSRAPARMKQMTMKASGGAGGKQMNIAKLAPVARPEELVGLDSPQHVELGGCFVDGRANGQRHQHKTDAVLLIPVVKTVRI